MSVAVGAIPVAATHFFIIIAVTARPVSSARESEVAGDPQQYSKYYKNHNVSSTHILSYNLPCFLLSFS